MWYLLFILEKTLLQKASLATIVLIPIYIAVDVRVARFVWQNNSSLKITSCIQNTDNKAFTPNSLAYWFVIDVNRIIYALHMNSVVHKGKLCLSTCLQSSYWCYIKQLLLHFLEFEKWPILVLMVGFWDFCTRNHVVVSYKKSSIKYSWDLWNHTDGPIIA